MTAVMMLDARLDLTRTRPLAQSLADHAGASLRVDAGQVDHLGALCTQALLAASQEWARNGLAFAIEPRSAAFDDALEAMGLAGAFCAGAVE